MTDFDDYELATHDPWAFRFIEVPCIWCGRPMMDNCETAPYCCPECASAAERDNEEDTK